MSDFVKFNVMKIFGIVLSRNFVISALGEGFSPFVVSFIHGAMHCNFTPSHVSFPFPETIC